MATKSKEESPSHEDLISELIRLGVSNPVKVPDDAKTMEEWATEWKCGDNKARRIVRELNAKGHIESLRPQIVGLDGRPNRTSVYRIVKSK